MAEKPDDPTRAALVAHKREIYSLAGETLALQALVVHLCRSLVQHDAALKQLISHAFDDAASFVEDVAIGHGESASAEHTVKAIRVVEELRAAVLGNETKPRHGI